MWEAKKQLFTFFTAQMHLEAVEATFYDDWGSIGLFDSAGVQETFLSFAGFNNYQALGEHYVGFVFEVSLADKKKVSQRAVYNIF